MEEIFDRKLTAQDIQKLNQAKPKYLSVRSSKFLDPRLIAELDNSIRIKIVTEDEEKAEQENGENKSVKVTPDVDESFSRDEMVEILNLYQDYEQGIHDDWPDLNRALYVYARMVAEYSVATPNQITSESHSLKSFARYNPNSQGLARNYKELMDRIGIPCRYVENSDGTHAWNEVMIDGTYYPVDLAIDSKESHAEGPGTILVHNFGKNSEFYAQPEHKVVESPKEFKTLDKDSVQKALNIVVDQIGVDENKRYEQIRENVTIELHSKELEGIFPDNTISMETLKDLKPLTISVQDTDVKALKDELQTIGKFYPEILNNVEIVNNTTAPVNVQEVVDGIYDARTVGSNLVINPISITIASQFEEDFDIDLSKVPQIAPSTTTKVDAPVTGQQIAFRNTDPSKKLKVPAFTHRISNNLSGMSFDGFDVEGLDLRDTGVSRLTFSNSSNIDKVFADTQVSYGIEVEISNPSDLTSALSNFRIHDLTIRNTNFSHRAILRELARNPELVKLSINDCHLDNLDGLEDFDNRLYQLDLQVNDLDISAIERIETFRKTNPYLEYYLSSNTGIQRVIDSLPEISDETYTFIKDYNTRTNEKFPVHNKSDAVNYLLWSHIELPYYIKDAYYFRQQLKMTSNPMMVENDHELETFDFNQAHLRNGTLYLTPAQVEHLISIGKTVPQNVRLKIESAADLSVDQTNDLVSRANAIGININEVQIYDASRHNNSQQIDPYSLSQYLYIRDTLDSLVSGISPTDADIDKFATIYQRLMDNITYDHDAVKEDDAASSRYFAEKRASSRNLLQGLEEWQCVCSGYADILRNALMMVGLNVENVSGFTFYNRHHEEDGFHAWNMVELDDGTGTKKWYNTDLTWSAGKSFSEMEKVTLRGDVPAFITNHMPYSTGLPIASSTDFDRHLLQAAFARARGKSFNIKTKKDEIDIPADPTLNIEIIDRDRILQEYTRRKNDMCAKYYGDKDYRREYMERSRRFRAHEIEDTDGSITYRKIEDYPEKDEDEQFLLLDKYSECLERMTRFEAGDTSIYTGTPDQIAQALAKDKEYVETRNHTFNKNKDMRNNLATLGKFGERVPYIPPQTGIVRNIGRAALNAGIFTRNLVSPIYRGIGRFIAVPIHRLAVGNRDASPFRNNWYHRMVARRDYFTEKNNTDHPGHALRNGLKARLDAVFKAKEGNQAVLNAGAAEIQANMVAQEREITMINSLNKQSTEFDTQIRTLQAQIAAHPTASNIVAVQTALADKIAKKDALDKKIATLYKGRSGIAQTDAISDAQHDVAVKEEVTLKTTVIKGFAKGLAVRYVGPKIHDWLSKRGTQTVTDQVTTQVPVTKQRWVDPTYKTESVPIYEDVMDTGKSMSDMMNANSGKTITGFYSVWGGEKNPASYTLTGNENITAIFHAQNGGGTGLSDIVGLKAPTLVDGTFGSDMLTSGGLLDQNITVDQLLAAIGNGSVDKSAIADMYVSIGDQYWAKLSDLTPALMSKVQTGTQLSKVIDVAGHMEEYTEYIDKVSNVVHTIPSDRWTRIANISDGLLYTGVATDSAIDLAENVRTTHTDTPDNKATPKQYTFIPPEPLPTSRKEYRDQRERD